MERPPRGRIQAIGAVYFILIALLVGLGLLIGPRIAAEGRSLAKSLPSLVDKMGSGQLVSRVGEKRGWSGAGQAQIQSFLVAHRANILGYGKVVGEKIAEPAKHIWWLIIIPILSVFFLKDGRSITDGMSDWGRDPENRSAFRGIISDVHVMLTSYLRAQLILASLTLVSYTLFLSVMRVPYAFILGPLAGICEFIPVVGPAVVVIAVFVIAVLTSSPHLIWLVLFLGGWRLLQDYVSAPKIMGESLEISPLLQIFAVLAGGEIGGGLSELSSLFLSLPRSESSGGE